MKDTILIITVILLLGTAVLGGALVILYASLAPAASTSEGLPVPEPKKANPIINSDNSIIMASTTPKKIVQKPKYSPSEPKISLVAVGDIMLSRAVERMMIKKDDFALPFEKIKDITGRADVTFGNLESPIISGPPVADNVMIFRADPKCTEGLKMAGFDVLSLANNHITNKGTAGLGSTIAELQKAGIKFAGLEFDNFSNAQIIEAKGIKLGFLAYTYNSSKYLGQMGSDRFKADIKNLKPKVDWVIVSMHSGSEYEDNPNKRQSDFAHLAIDAGADLVLGHHPHVVQTIEKYKDRFIIYSLGNFVFDQLWSEDTKNGLIAKIIFTPTQIRNIDLIPIIINKNYQPEVATLNTAQKIINRLEFSNINQTGYTFKDNLVSNPTWRITPIKAGMTPTIYQAYDFDRDGQAEDAVVVDGTAYLIKNDEVVWSSDEEWRVENVVIGDFTNDGQVELGISLWKEGSFGTSRPFWVEENDANLSNHLFLYQWDDNAISSDSLKMVWGSSELDSPIKEMAVFDLNNDGRNELVVLESNEKNQPQGPTENLSIWHFNNFLFYNDDKVPAPGAFGLSIEDGVVEFSQ